MEIEEFCEKLLGVKLHPVQVEILKCVTKNTRVHMESDKYREFRLRRQYTNIYKAKKLF